MTDFTVIQTPENQPYYSFFHLDQEYFIWFWLSDGGPDVSQACLSQPYTSGNGSYTPNNVLVEFAHSNRINEVGGINAFMNDIFLPKVNEYLAAQGGGDSGFPVNGADMEKFNWIVENSLSYANGKINFIDV